MISAFPKVSSVANTVEILNSNIDSDMTTTSAETGSADDSTDTLSADDNSMHVGAYVDKTNTVVVTNDSKAKKTYSQSNPRQQTSHNSNDLYSLKITFV